MSKMSTKGEPCKQTEIGEVPESWEVVQIGEVGQVVTGNTPKTSVPEYYGGPYMFIAPGDISGDQYVTKTNKYVSAEGLKVLRPLPRNSVLVVCIGATIGKAAMTSVEQSATNQQINSIIPNAKAYPHYVYYAVTYRSRRLPSLASRAAIPIVKKSIFAKFPIPLPPLPEQRAIAHVLQTIQEAKTVRQHELALERERKAALMDYLFSYGTKGEPRKQTEIGEIPESWEVVQIGEIGQVVTGNTPKTSVPEYYGGPYMFIAPGDISEAQYVTKTNKYVSAEGLKVLRPLPCNAVLVVCIGATIGKTAMTSVEPSVTNQQINSIIPNAKAFPHYVYYAVTYRSHRLPSLAGRAAIPIVKKSIFAKFPILLPPLSEQHAIAETLRAFDAKIAALEQEGECIDELFHAMLDELMTGQRSAVTLIDSELLN